MELRASPHPLAPLVLDDALGHFGSRPTGTMERAAGTRRKTWARWAASRFVEAAEDVNGRATGIALRLDHQRRRRRDQHRLRDSPPGLPELRDIPGDLADCRMAAVHQIPSVERNRPTQLHSSAYR